MKKEAQKDPRAERYKYMKIVKEALQQNFLLPI